MRAIPPAARTKNIYYAIRELTAIAERMPGRVDYYSIGDPVRPEYDFRTPQHMIDAVVKAMQEGRNFYPPSMGIPEAVEAIRNDAARKGIAGMRRVIVTMGASEAIEMCLTSLANRGENVLCPLPGYPLYPAVLAKLEVGLKPYYLDEENGWQPDVDDIARRIDSKTRAIVVINPNNPTGSVTERKTLKGILDLAGQHSLVVLADEIYDRMVYPGATQTAMASLASDVPVVTFNGLAKNYLAPGWRVGWLILSGDENMVGEFGEAMAKIARARLCANYPMQCAIRPALEGPQDHIPATIRKLEERAAYVKRRCDEIPGMSLTPPRAAFYAFPRIEVADDEKFVKEFLAKERALVINGGGFGQRPGTSHLRIVYLPPIPLLESLFEKLERFLNQL